MANEYVVLVKMKIGEPPSDAINKVFDSAKDWMRWRAGVWFIATNQSHAYWQDQIKRLLGPEDQFLIVKLDPQFFQGWTDGIPREYFSRNHDIRPGL